MKNFSLLFNSLHAAIIAGLALIGCQVWPHHSAELANYGMMYFAGREIAQAQARSLQAHGATWTTAKPIDLFLWLFDRTVWNSHTVIFDLGAPALITIALNVKGL